MGGRHGAAEVLLDDRDLPARPVRGLEALPVQDAAQPAGQRRRLAERGQVRDGGEPGRLDRVVDGGGVEAVAAGDRVQPVVEPLDDGAPGPGTAGPGGVDQPGEGHVRGTAAGVVVRRVVGGGGGDPAQGTANLPTAFRLVKASETTVGRPTWSRIQESPGPPGPGEPPGCGRTPGIPRPIRARPSRPRPGRPPRTGACAAGSAGARPPCAGAGRRGAPPAPAPGRSRR